METLQAVRLLPFTTQPGPEAMATDEALLTSAAARDLATLRFYAWRVPTVSLGYFQPASARELDTRLAGLPWLRRSTGGAALVHHHELTYAFALPAGKRWHPGELSWLCRAHHAIRNALGELGASTRAVVCGEEQKLGEVLCFLHQTPADLLAAGAKVVGSAQRKSHGALLQHGGILLERSEFAPELAGLADLTGVSLEAEALARTLAARFASDFGWRLELGELTDDERGEVAATVAAKYGNPAWNEKR